MLVREGTTKINFGKYFNNKINYAFENEFRGVKNFTKIVHMRLNL